MIPTFTPAGLLPPGIHWAKWDELVARYGINPHRARLLSGLERACDALRTAGCHTLYLDGSFVTAKVYPSDYDGCWDTAGVNSARLDPVLLDFKNDRAAQKAKYLGELFLCQAVAKLGPPQRVFLDFFQHDKNTDELKGIVGLNL
ncbi:MAG: hypothetical protein H7A44_08675 [Opitutaceae bacterium]|nr:hypothetical protein [Cephaloticoccus sp.]MCP5530505.1 hypothetical protein [Opitutaceae bacterium]